MKFGLIFVFLTLFESYRADVLEEIYDNLNSIYHRYRRRGFLDQNQWQSIMEPIDLTSNRVKTSQVFDFIIVGSGSAGAVIANRLSEIADWNILLLEAGRGENIISQIPLVAPVMALTPYNWNYTAEYQPNMSSGFNEQRMLWPRGKALGGTTVINFMIYTRGNKWDYDRWAAIGNPGWSYQDVLPYFIKSERSSLVNENAEVHGHDGYLHVSNIYRSPLVDAFIEGGNQLGLPTIDYNANYQSFGVSAIHTTTDNGRRDSVAKAFLQPFRARHNLFILTSAFVTKILIDPTTREAYGVQYESSGKKYTVRARREVILSAGTFNSPQLLMLAGIGPRQHLQELGIPVLQDLPVGRNLYDHLTFPGLSFLINQPLSLSAEKLINPLNIIDYLGNGRGPYTSLGGVEAIGYIKTNQSKEVIDIPDIELLFTDGCLSTDYGLFNRQWMNIRRDVFDPVWAPIYDIPCWTIFPMLLHPKSSGYLKLQSTNPRDFPLLYGNYFTDPEDHDVKTLIAAIRVIERLASTPPFQKYRSTLHRTKLPVCRQHEFDSDAYWACALRAISVTLHHQVGTCKMGPAEDPTSVVDNQLRVYGVGRLRVADCSVVPFAVGAHTNAVAIMVGEKAADYIKDTWGRRNG